jgi:hypothetical protein
MVWSGVCGADFARKFSTGKTHDLFAGDSLKKREGNYWNVTQAFFTSASAPARHR